jgi:menaquinone-dependent protoporphyrinogen oxidase
MKIKVLVVYASKYGSTQEVADTVTATLRDHEFEVDFQPVGKVRTLEGYRAIILGAPIYLGAWHKDALGFLGRYQEGLMERSVAVFALGPIHDPTNEKEWQESRASLEKGLAKYPWLTPVALEVFGGKFDPAKLRLPDRLITSLPASPLHQMPPSDLRDWTAIRAWASDLAAKLQPALTQ